MFGSRKRSTSSLRSSLTDTFRIKPTTSVNSNVYFEAIKKLSQSKLEAAKETILPNVMSGLSADITYCEMIIRNLSELPTEARPSTGEIPSQALRFLINIQAVLTKWSHLPVYYEPQQKWKIGDIFTTFQVSSIIESTKNLIFINISTPKP